MDRVRFEGNAIFPSQTLAGRLQLKNGAFYTEASLQHDITAIRDAYGELGYVEADVGSRYLYKDQPGVVDVVFTITEGRQVHLGDILVRGNDITQGHVVRRELGVYPQQLYNTVAIERSRKRLTETGLFGKVEMRRVDKTDKVSDLLVHVEEGQTATFAIGAGISTRDGLIGDISYTERNFDLFGWLSPGHATGLRKFRGAGQQLNIVARPGTEVNEFFVNWLEPYLMDHPYSLGSKTFFYNRQFDDYDETRYGEIASLGHRFENGWYTELADRIEGVDLSNLDSDIAPEIREDAGTHIIDGIKGTVVRDRTDSRWLPSTGDRLTLSYEEVVLDYTFGVANADYDIYRTIYVDSHDRKHILAGRVTAGKIFGDAPVFERFYAGGTGSVRGFEYRGISPRSKFNDDAIGGNTLLLAGTEYNFPLFGDPESGELRGVVFMDTGTVEESCHITKYPQRGRA